MRHCEQTLFAPLRRALGSGEHGDAPELPVRQCMRFDRLPARFWRRLVYRGEQVARELRDASLRRAVAGLPAIVGADLHPVLRRVYAARGVTSADELDLGLDRLLPVSSLGGVDAAVDLLVAMHDSAGRIVVVGDFDADGATSTALVVRQLRRLGFCAPDYVVPDRFRYGYGLSPAIVRAAAERKPRLLITVDNGVASHEGVAEARRLGIEVLITDHHLPGPALPEAAAIVNPNLPGERFGSKALAGVGVAFYVMAALTRRLAERREQARLADANVADLLDLVALGTVADVVPLDFNNRILVAQGMRRVRAGPLRARDPRAARRGGPRARTVGQPGSRLPGRRRA